MSRYIDPCPYCGNEKPGYTADYRPKFLFWGRFTCHECGVTGPWGDGIDEAKEKWNAMPRREETMSDRVMLPPIEPFKGELIPNSKATALKPLEEAAEAFGAWQNVYEHNNDWCQWEPCDVLWECADVIQATVNLACAVVARECEERGKPFSADEVALALSGAYEVVHAGNGSRGRHE